MAKLPRPGSLGALLVAGSLGGGNYLSHLRRRIAHRYQDQWLYDISVCLQLGNAGSQGSARHEAQRLIELADDLHRLRRVWYFTFLRGDVATCKERMLNNRPNTSTLAFA